MSYQLEIRMQSGEVTCFLCGAWTAHQWSVPVFNGDVVSNDFPDELWAGGGGQAVCEECYDRHAAGKVPTFDRFYLHLAGGLEGGEGI